MSARPPVFLNPLLAPERLSSQVPEVAASRCPGHALSAGAARSLRARRKVRLSVLTGRAWVTLGEPRLGHGVPLGDLILQAGDSVSVPPGARVVIESMHESLAGPLRFDWCEEAPTRVPASSSRFGREVVVPARDLVQALAQAVMALARLSWGVLGYADLLVAGRGRVLSRWESNPP